MSRFRNNFFHLLLLLSTVLFTLSSLIHHCGEHDDECACPSALFPGEGQDVYELAHQAHSFQHLCALCPVCNGTLAAEPGSPTIWTIRPEPGVFFAGVHFFHAFAAIVLSHARSPPVTNSVMN